MYGVVGSEDDLYVGLFEQVSDEVSFFTDVCESGPLWCWGLCVCICYLFFVSVGGGCGVGGGGLGSHCCVGCLDGGDLCLVVVL